MSSMDLRANRIITNKDTLIQYMGEQARYLKCSLLTHINPFFLSDNIDASHKFSAWRTPSNKLAITLIRQNIVQGISMSNKEFLVRLALNTLPIFNDDTPYYAIIFCLSDEYIKEI